MIMIYEPETSKMIWACFEGKSQENLQQCFSWYGCLRSNVKNTCVFCYSTLKNFIFVVRNMEGRP